MNFSCSIQFSFRTLNYQAKWFTSRNRKCFEKCNMINQIILLEIDQFFLRIYWFIRKTQQKYQSMTAKSYIKFTALTLCLLISIYSAVVLPIPPVSPNKILAATAAKNATIKKTNTTQKVVKSQNNTNVTSSTPTKVLSNATKTSQPQVPDEKLEQFFPEDKSAELSGCYVRNPTNFGLKYAKAMVPLRNIDYNIEIVDGLAHFTLEQLYQNPSSRFITVFYSFPMQPESCLYKFVAQFGNVVVEGVIKEKDQAKKQFQKAKSEGKQAALASINSNSRDIIDLEIGNVPPKTKVKITISFIQEMSLGLNTFYKLQVPSTISPRFMNTLPDESFTSLEQAEVKKQIVPVEPTKEVAESTLNNDATTDDKITQTSVAPAGIIDYSIPSMIRPPIFPIPFPIPFPPFPVRTRPDFNWSFNIDLKSTKKIIFYNSTSHKLKKVSESEDGNHVVLTLEKSSRPNKDFVFVYTPDQFQLPSYALGKGNDTYTVMLSFIPKFSTLSNEQAYKALVQKQKTIETDLNTVKGQYVFILDRSGSMDGQRIVKAKQALIIFLKSLPEDCYFNVISFGSNYQKLYSESLKYGNAKVKETINLIQKMGADFGGTQIYYPLEKVLTQGDIQGYPKFVFLLTDGAVSNTEGVIAMAKQKLGKSRIYSIGIGNGASLRLIQGCAEVGRGRYVMIEDLENPSQKIIELLESTLSPLITKFSLKYDDTNRQSITPNPEKSYILKDDLVIFYITYRGQLKSKKKFSLQYEDSVTNKVHNIQIQVDPSTPNYPFVNKMAHFKVLRLLQNLSKNMSSDYEGVYSEATKDDYKAKATRYSVHYQILSEYTSFVAIGKQLTNKEKNQWKELGVQVVQVEQPLPIEYERSGNSAFAPIYAIKPSVGRGGFSGLIGGGGVGKYSIGGIGGISALNVMPAPAPLAPSFVPSIMPTYDARTVATTTSSKNSNSAVADTSFAFPVQVQAEQADFAQPSSPSASVTAATLTIEGLINMQNFDGSWTGDNLIDLLSKNPNEANSLAASIRMDIITTKLALLWLSNRTPGKQYSLIIKKAETWLKNAINADNVDQSHLNVLEAL